MELKGAINHFTQCLLKLYPYQYDKIVYVHTKRKRQVHTILCGFDVTAFDVARLTNSTILLSTPFNSFGAKSATHQSNCINNGVLKQSIEATKNQKKYKKIHFI